jgi:hypothetical protein
MKESIGQNFVKGVKHARIGAVTMIDRIRVWIMVERFFAVQPDLLISQEWWNAYSTARRRYLHQSLER